MTDFKWKQLAQTYWVLSRECHLDTKSKVEELYRITSQVLVAGQVRVHSIFFLISNNTVGKRYYCCCRQKAKRNRIKPVRLTTLFTFYFR